MPFNKHLYFLMLQRTFKSINGLKGKSFFYLPGFFSMKFMGKGRKEEKGREEKGMEGKGKKGRERKEEKKKS